MIFLLRSATIKLTLVIICDLKTYHMHTTISKCLAFMCLCVKVRTHQFVHVVDLCPMSG